MLESHVSGFMMSQRPMSLERLRLRTPDGRHGGASPRCGVLREAGGAIDRSRGAESRRATCNSSPVHVSAKGTSWRGSGHNALLLYSLKLNLEGVGLGPAKVTKQKYFGSDGSPGPTPRSLGQRCHPSLRNSIRNTFSDFRWPTGNIAVGGHDCQCQEHAKTAARPRFSKRQGARTLTAN